MYMNQENKNKIAIVGHTKGIGKAIAKLYESKKYEVIGLSRSNGYDLITEQEKIMDKIVDMMENYSKYVTEIQRQKKQLKTQFFHG